MTLISNLKELLAIIRSAIISQSLIDENHVINGQSLYGATLQKNESDSVLESFDEDDEYCVFNVNNSLSNDDIVEDTEQGFDVYSSFTSTCMFYGKNCGLNAIRVKSRFLTAELLSDFLNQGIHIQEIESKEQVNDFINGKLVTRQDIVIHFSCSIDIKKLKKAEPFEAANISKDWLTIK